MAPLSARLYLQTHYKSLLHKYICFMILQHYGKSMDVYKHKNYLVNLRERWK